MGVNMYQWKIESSNTNDGWVKYKPKGGLIPWITTVLLLGGRPPSAHFVFLVLPQHILYSLSSAHFALPKSVSSVLPGSVNVLLFESNIECTLVLFLREGGNVVLLKHFFNFCG